jgi:tripartite-type tricarboxylate transporter receptor subunit TctC
MQKRTIFVALMTLAFTLGNLPGATAQGYPSRPIRMLIPTTAGGPTDTIGRIMADGMRAHLAQPVVIENVPGASGSLGAGRVAKAAPDGYTLGLGNLPWYVFNGAIYDLPYDLATAFEPVSLITSDPIVLVTRKDLPAKDLKELIGWLKTKHDPALAGTGGIGSLGQIVGVNFEKATGSDLQFVPFRGFAEAGTGLMGGHIDLLMGPIAGFLPQVRAGTMKAYAVFEKTRLAAAPEIPTADEAAAPGLVMSSWHAFFVPRGTPKDIIATLNAAAVKALSDPTVRQRLTDIGQKLYPAEELTPETLGVRQKADIEKWWPIIKAAGIRAE